MLRVRIGNADHLERGGNDTYITDVYDEKRRVFLVQYPVWFIVALSLSGVLAFALTGFLGYRERGAAVDGPFEVPWALYFWFCAVLVTLQISILRNPRLRGRLAATLVISVLCILVIFLTGLNPFDFLRRLLDEGLKLLKSDAITYAFINFAIIIVFWVDTVRRWIRRSQGFYPNPRVDLKTGERIDVPTPGDTDLPSLSELIAGDLIAGAVLTVLLALFFTPAVITTFVKTAVDHPINDCTLSVPGTFVVDAANACIKHPLTLSFVDQIQALLFLPLGLLTLALTAVLEAFDKLRPENSMIAMRAPNRNDRGGLLNTAIAVVQVILDTLRAALDRQIRGLARNLALSLRTVGWPLLILFGVYGVSEMTKNVQQYLHHTKGLTDTLTYQVPAIGWGLVAVLGVVFSAALIVFRWRVAENSLRFLGLIGFVVLLTFWIFSLALWGINRLLLLILSNGYPEVDQRPSLWHPFDLGASTLISATALLIFGSILAYRSLRSRGQSDQANAAVPVQAGKAPAAPTSPRQPEH